MSTKEVRIPAVGMALQGPRQSPPLEAATVGPKATPKLPNGVIGVARTMDPPLGREEDILLAMARIEERLEALFEREKQLVLGIQAPRSGEEEIALLTSPTKNPVTKSSTLDKEYVPSLVTEVSDVKVDVPKTSAEDPSIGETMKTLRKMRGKG